MYLIHIDRSSHVWHSKLNGKIWIFLKTRIKIGQNKLWIKSRMKILQSRRPLTVVAGIKKTHDHTEPTQSTATHFY